MRYFFIPCLLAVTLAATTPLLAADVVASSAKSVEPRIVSSFTADPGAHYPFRQNMYRALLLPDGKIIALSIARHQGQQTMQGRYSSDNGQTWSEARDLFQWPKEAGGFGLFNAIVDEAGEIHIWVLCDANSGTLFPKEEEATPKRPGQILDIWHVRSRDGRSKWTIPMEIWQGHGDDLLSGIQLRSGRLVLPFAYATPRSWGNRGGGFYDFTFIGTYSVKVVYSDDDGETWKTSNEELVVETPDLFTYGANEPVVLQLKDGRVWMLIRTQRGRFYESFSDDGSKWSVPTPSKLISSDAPAGLLRLKDGSILLFSNECLRYPYGYGGRYVLHVAISKDEGKTWRGYREVARDPARNEPESLSGDYGVGYTFPTLTNDGKVLFSNWVEQGTVRNFRIFDPAWIYETHQNADFSQGIDDWSVFGSKGVELQPDTDHAGAKILAIHKADPEWPAGAVWNFPVGSKGQMKIQLRIQPNFKGTLIGLTDHFSIPWDLDDQFFNAFNLRIAPDGGILPNLKLAPGRWYNVTLDWDTDTRKCRIFVDGKLAGAIEDNRVSSGINYLRLRSVSDEPDGGLQIRGVSADVSASWKTRVSAVAATGTATSDKK
jgi:hypothetical protein